MDWKKEYKFSDLMRRGDGEAPAERPEAPAAPATQAPGDSTMWKKEIRIGGLFRRRKPAKQRALPQIGDTVREGAQQTVATSAPPADGSIWKKEIKLSSLFRRRKAAPSRRQLALPAPGGTVVDAPTPEASRAAAPPVQPPETVVEQTPVEATAPETVVAATAPETPASDSSAEQASSTESPADPEPAQPVAEAPPPQAEPAAEGAASTAPKDRLWKREIGRKRQTESPQEKPERGKRPERREREESPKQARESRAESRGSRGGGTLPQVPLMKAVNLLPQDIKLPKTTLRPWVAQVAVGVVGVLVVGGMAFLFLNERNRLADRASALEDARAELAAVEAEAQQPVAVESGPALEGEALARATALSSAIDGRRGWDRLLRELSLTIPANVWFTKMATTSATQPVVPSTTDAAAVVPIAPVQTADTVSIEGYAMSQADVAQFLARLEVVPEFSSIQLQSAVADELSGQHIITFTIHGALKAPVQVTP